MLDAGAGRVNLQSGVMLSIMGVSPGAIPASDLVSCPRMKE